MLGQCSISIIPVHVRRHFIGAYKLIIGLKWVSRFVLMFRLHAMDGYKTKDIENFSPLTAKICKWVWNLNKCKSAFKLYSNVV